MIETEKRVSNIFLYNSTDSAPLGRRQWKMFFATVRGLTLYMHKNERGFEGSRFEVFQNCIRLHHAFAEPASDYTKRSHVFRITTAKLGEYLLQTSSPEELTKWVCEKQL